MLQLWFTCKVKDLGSLAGKIKEDLQNTQYNGNFKLFLIAVYFDLENASKPQFYHRFFA